MPDYKKHYSALVSAIDDALTLMDNDDLLQWDKIKARLQQALLDVEDQVIEEMDGSEEETEIDKNS